MVCCRESFPFMVSILAIYLMSDVAMAAGAEDGIDRKSRGRVLATASATAGAPRRQLSIFDHDDLFISTARGGGKKSKKRHSSSSSSSEEKSTKSGKHSKTEKNTKSGKHSKGKIGDQDDIDEADESAQRSDIDSVSMSTTPPTRPTSSKPPTMQPTTMQPTMEPTTMEPTTTRPTTAQPTTAKPTTTMPTTIQPTRQPSPGPTPMPTPVPSTMPAVVSSADPMTSPPVTSTPTACESCGTPGPSEEVVDDNDENTVVQADDGEESDGDGDSIQRNEEEDPVVDGNDETPVGGLELNEGLPSDDGGGEDLIAVTDNQEDEADESKGAPTPFTESATSASVKLWTTLSIIVGVGGAAVYL